MGKRHVSAFGTDWNLNVTDKPDGGFSANTDTIVAAGVMQTAKKIDETNTLLRELLRIFRCTNTQAGFRALRSLARSERQRLERSKKRGKK